MSRDELQARLTWFRKQEAKWAAGAVDKRYSESTRHICAKNAEGYRVNAERVEAALGKRIAR